MINPQFISSSMVLLASFLYGCKVGYTQAVTPMFLSENAPFPVTAEEMSWVASISYCGTLISVIFCCTVGNRIRRRATLFGCTLVFAVTWILMLTTSSVTVVVVCMFFYGIAASVMVVIGHIYFTEIASPRNREVLAITYNLATSIGVHFELLLSTFDEYRMLTLLPVSVAVLALLLVTVMVESPYYLIANGLEAEAVESIRRLHRTISFTQIAAKIKIMQKYVAEQNQLSRINRCRVVLYESNLKQLLVMVMIIVMARVQTMTIVLHYGSAIISPLETVVSGRLFVGVYNAMLVVGTVTSFLTIKKFGRRAILLYGFFACGVIQWCCALCYNVENENENRIRPLAVLIEILLIVFMLVCVSTLSALNVLKAEIFPHNLKEFCMSLLAFSGDCTSFVIVKAYFTMVSNWGLPCLLLLYSCFSFVGMSFIYIFVRDTKGKSLYQIRMEYTDKLKRSRLNTI